MINYVNIQLLDKHLDNGLARRRPPEPIIEPPPPPPWDPIKALEEPVDLAALPGNGHKIQRARIRNGLHHHKFNKAAVVECLGVSYELVHDEYTKENRRLEINRRRAELTESVDV